jgi:hypothetical protein
MEHVDLRLKSQLATPAFWSSAWNLTAPIATLLLLACMLLALSAGSADRSATSAPPPSIDALRYRFAVYDQVVAASTGPLTPTESRLIEDSSSSD